MRRISLEVGLLPTCRYLEGAALGKEGMRGSKAAMGISNNEEEASLSLAFRRTLTSGHLKGVYLEEQWKRGSKE